MEIEILTIGRTTAPYLRQGIEEYLQRLGHYATTHLTELPDPRRGKAMSESELKQREGKLILQFIKPSDLVVLLDERGKEYTSPQLATWLDKRLSTGRKRLILAIGGPYGFSQQVYARADDMLSLSRMTFNHEMVRLFLAEQIYRAFTILNHQPYHHA